MRTSLSCSLCVVIVLAFTATRASAQSTPHIPRPGSPERQAICDAARDHVVKKYVTQTLPGPIVFHVDHLAVQNGYCFFEGTPRFKNGSYVPTNYLPDMAYNFCLRKNVNGWTIILDLSRSDVPSADEIQEIKKQLPSDFPLAVFSSGWRQLLGGN